MKANSSADLYKGDEYSRMFLQWALKGRSKEIAINLIDELMHIIQVFTLSCYLKCSRLPH